ncbi:hypothetical protein QBC42DRAFT_295531 [Cladorrhinum samala]|uniref:NAD(P)-binding domain-containing protein n=1 Tax=Cladorrhinum samala TaxID=585594 RepID=A0AAV9HUQ2_9PEZI|nr:hypothetical protein QBC42DRAFT_295531 [Cladorrhinum samala]
MSTTKTILFLGATGGVAFSALQRSLKAGYTCIALCRNPAGLSSKFPDPDTPRPNLHIVHGNAHSVPDLIRCLTLTLTLTDTSTVSPVTHIFSSIGSWPSLTSPFTIADPKVCETGMAALLSAISSVRKSSSESPGSAAATTRTGPPRWSPRIIATSSTGLSSVQRDIPVVYVPLYHVLLRQAHKDKKNMEDLLIGSGEADWTIVRASLYVDSKPGEDGKKTRVVRAGKEDPVAKVVERKEVGYTISREDVGRWMFEELVERDGGEWQRRVASITY